MSPEEEKEKETTGQAKTTGGPIERNKRTHGEHAVAAEEDSDCLDENGEVEEDCKEETTDGAPAAGPIRGQKRTHGEARHEREMESE